MYQLPVEPNRVHKMANVVEFLKITFHLSSIGKDTLKILKNGAFWLLLVLNFINGTYIQVAKQGKLKCEARGLKESEIPQMTDFCLSNGFLYPMNGEPHYKNKTNLGKDCISTVDHNEFK